MIRALHDEDPRIRYLAAEALGAIQPDGREAVSALKDSLGDESYRVRIEAARALRED